MPAWTSRAHRSIIRFSRRDLLKAASAAAALVVAGRAYSAAPATEAASPLLYPLALSVDADGAIFVVDLLLPGVWKVVDGKASPFHKAEKKFRGPLAHPRAILAVASDQVVVADTAARDLFLLKAGEAPRSLVGGNLDAPAALLQADDEILVADTQRNEIWSGGVDAAWSKWAAVPSPRGLAIDAEKRVLAISARDNVLYRIAGKGSEPKKIAQGEPRSYWSSVAIGADGVPVVVDSYAKTLWRIEEGKAVEWVKDPQFDHPVGLVRRGDDFLVTDSRAKAIFVVTAEGKTTPLELTTG